MNVLARLPLPLQQMLLLEWLVPEAVCALARAGSSQLRRAVLTSPCAFRAADRTIVRGGCVRWFQERGVPLRLWARMDDMIESGTKVWYLNGCIHRDDDLPAVVHEDGTRMWHQRGLRHRDNDQPAVMDADGTRIWYQNGKKHRADGRPAVIGRFGGKEYFEHDKATRQPEGFTETFAW